MEVKRSDVKYPYEKSQYRQNPLKQETPSIARNPIIKKRKKKAQVFPNPELSKTRGNKKQKSNRKNPRLEFGYDGFCSFYPIT